MSKQEAEYMLDRLERIKELLDAGNTHMAQAKLLADIAALRQVCGRDIRG